MLLINKLIQKLRSIHNAKELSRIPIVSLEEELGLLEDDFGFTMSSSYDTDMESFKEESKTTQICYIPINKQEAIDAVNKQAIPMNTKAYEYIENIKPKQDEVILAVEIDTTNMLDLTNNKEFSCIIKNNISSYKDIVSYAHKNNKALIRMIRSNEKQIYNQYNIILIILNNSVVHKVYKV